MIPAHRRESRHGGLQASRVSLACHDSRWVIRSTSHDTDSASLDARSRSLSIVVQPATSESVLPGSSPVRSPSPRTSQDIGGELSVVLLVRLCFGRGTDF